MASRSFTPEGAYDWRGGGATIRRRERPAICDLVSDLLRTRQREKRAESALDPSNGIHDQTTSVRPFGPVFCVDDEFESIPYLVIDLCGFEFPFLVRAAGYCQNQRYQNSDNGCCYPCIEQDRDTLTGNS